MPSVPFANELQSATYDVLQYQATLQRPLAQMRAQYTAEQPLRGTQTPVVFEPALAQRDQIAPDEDVCIGFRVRGATHALLELEHIPRSGLERLAARCVAVELDAVTERVQEAKLENAQRPRHDFGFGQLREAATIAGKNLGVGIATDREPEQQLVRVIGAEQALRREVVASARGLHLRQAS